VSGYCGGASAWTGHELLTWGGTECQGDSYIDAGAEYDPSSGALRPLPKFLSGRTGMAFAWTGTELLIWGGRTDSNGRVIGDGASLRYLAPNPNNSDSALDSRWSTVAGDTAGPLFEAATVDAIVTAAHASGLNHLVVPATDPTPARLRRNTRLVGRAHLLGQGIQVDWALPGADPVLSWMSEVPSSYLRAGVDKCGSHLDVTAAVIQHVEVRGRSGCFVAGIGGETVKQNSELTWYDGSTFFMVASVNRSGRALTEDEILEVAATRTTDLGG
jgi:hypothetical protein